MRPDPALLAAARLFTAGYVAFIGLNVRAADAPPPGLVAAFGNTVKATYPDKRFQRYWFKADGTWRAIGRRGTASSGKWTAKGDTVCLRQTKPFPAPMKYCTSFPATGKVGSSWPAKDAGGGKIVLSLVEGGG